MAKVVKCLICDKKFQNNSSLYTHIENKHEEQIPSNFTPSQYHFYLKTGKEFGSCVVCGDNTKWNDVTNKYHRFCPNESCKEKYIDEFKKRMISKYGKVSLLDDPNHQRKMLANRKISGMYIWSDGSKKTYTGKYELDFLKFLDAFMDFDSKDIIAPSPHTYGYIYEGEKKFYIPDIYIPSLNLEIEIKASDNMHHKIQAVDKVKEKLKDEVMYSIKNINYIKVFDKKYDGFIQYLIDLKNTNDNKKGYEYKNKNNKITESLEISDLTLDDILDLSESFKTQFIYDIERITGIEKTPITENFVYDPDFNKKTEPIYIVLFSNNTFKGSVIKKITNSLYTHVSLSLDTSLNNLYAFNTGVDNGGFYIESIYSPKFRECEYFTVSVIFVTPEMKNKILNRLNVFLNNKSKYKYNVEGLLKYFLKFKDLGNSSPDEKTKFFCSEFIAYLLKDTSPDFSNILVSPGEFISATGFKNLKTYTIPYYDEKEVIQLTKYAREELLMLNRGVNIKEFFKPLNNKEAKEYYNDIEKYKNNIDWKKSYDTFRKLFFMNRDDMNIYFDMVDIILFEHVKKTNKDNIENILLKELGSIYNHISNNVDGLKKIFTITHIDVKNSTIYLSFSGNDGNKVKIKYPLEKNVLTESNISGIMYPDSISLNIKLNPDELCSTLATFLIGIWDRRQKYINVSPTPEEIFNSYKSMSIQEFEEHKVGLSWDFSNYIKTYFSVHYPNIIINQYLLEAGNLGTSYHSFTIFEENGEYKLIEPVYKNNIGVHSFTTINKAFDFVINMVTKSNVDKKIYKYDSIPIGGNIIDIITDIENNSELVFEQ